MMRKIASLLAVGLALGISTAALAQANFPNRPIKIIMPAGAGGSSDAYVRQVANELAVQFGQPVVVENQAGAGGVIGTSAIVRSAPDGYTLGWTTDSYLSHHVTSKEVKYRWPDDFVFVHKGTSVQVALVVNAASPIKTAQEFLAYAKANPGKLNVANPGLFTQGHVTSKLYQAKTGVQFTDIAYRTSPDMTKAVFAGEADAFFTVPGLFNPGLQSGSVRVLAVLSDQRIPGLDAPTLKETGVDLTYSVFQGFVLPKGTPPEIADRFHAAITKANESAGVKKMVAEQSLVVHTEPRAVMQKSVEDTIKALEQLMRDAKLEPI